MATGRGRRALGTVAIVVSGLALATLVASLGPSREVVCGTGHALDRIAQAVAEPLGGGHIDGPSATLCVVPSTLAWILAGVAFAAVTVAGLLLVARRRSAVGQDVGGISTTRPSTTP